MKTRVLSIIVLFFAVMATTKSTYAAPANHTVVTILTDISSINKIEVHGNVELYVSDGPADQVKVYNQYYAESALVQNVNGVLRISSYNPEKLVVWVTANDLRSISAYDAAVVKSFGNLSKIEFDVDLHDNASAKLNLDAYSATLTVKDNAKADIAGTATNFSLNRNMASAVINTNFKAINYTENKSSVTAATSIDDVVVI